MASITIFGDGNMGTAIGGIATTAGATVQTITTVTPPATIEGDIVVLAVPYPSLASIAASYGPQLAGKVVVDITNPLDFQTLDALTVPLGSSAAAELAALLPEAKVLKAFNTTFAATLATGVVGGLPTTVLVAGDDAEAKQALIGLVKAGGLDALDAGSLKRAHELEALGFLQLTLAIAGTVPWTGGFAVAK
ncbi:MAG: NAD(P)-binding domain-containing protein [Propionicimonas sp.]